MPLGRCRAPGEQLSTISLSADLCTGFFTFIFCCTLLSSGVEGGVLEVLVGNFCFFLGEGDGDESLLLVDSSIVGDVCLDGGAEFGDVDFLGCSVSDAELARSCSAADSS